MSRRDYRAETALAEVSEEHEKTAMMTAARATTVFTAAEIRVACDGFSSKKLIGRGVRKREERGRFWSVGQERKT